MHKSRAIASLLLAVYLPGCYTWRPTSVAPTDLVAGDARALLVTDEAGTTRELPNPAIRNDSLVHVPQHCTAESFVSECRDRVDGFALSEITEVSTREHTALFWPVTIVTVGVSTLAVLLAIGCQGSDQPTGYGSFC